MIMENVTLAICSVTMLLTIAFMVYEKRACLGLVELYAAMVGFYFGAWGILDAYMQDFSGYNVLAIILVYSIITTTLYFTWYLLRVYLPNKNHASYLSYLEFGSIARIVRKVPQRYVALLVCALFLFKIYSIQKYNIVNNYDWNSLAEYHIVLPGWFSIVDGMLRSILFIAIFPTVIGIFATRSWTKALWIAIAAMIIFIEAMYGRSSVLNFIIIFLLYWYVEKDNSRLTRGLVIAGLVLGVLLMMYSNFYQAYRSIFILKYGYTQSGSYVANKLIPTLKENGSIVKKVMDSSKTINNFKDRPALWRFNYRFIDQQLDGGYVFIPNGALLKDAVIFMLPRAVWHNKPHFLLQPEAYKLYHFDYKYSDAPSIFGFVQIDFGFLSFLIIPLFLLLGFVPSAWLMRLASDRPFLFTIIAGEFGYFCIDIIRDYYGLFMYYRELTFLLIFYLMFSFVKLRLTNKSEKIAVSSMKTQWN